MRQMFAVLLLSAALMLTPSPPMANASPAHNSAEASAAVIAWPQDGATFTNQFGGPIQIDLSASGATDPTQDFEVSYRDNTDVWHPLATLSGTAARNDVALPHALTSGDYVVRVDPTWLDDTQSVESNFSVVSDPYVWISVNDGGDAFPHNQVDVDAILAFVESGETVQWNIRRSEACGGDGLPSCDPLSSGTITASGGYERIKLPVTDLPGGDYEVTIYRADNPWEDRASAWFTVLPAPEITALTISPETFYPLVRDGHRDKATMVWRQNLAADTSVEVLRDRRVVRRARLGSLSAGRHTWAWDGRKNNGDKAATGRYRLRVKMTDSTGAVDSAHVGVKVATTIITRRATIERRGTRTSARSKAGNCYFRAYSGELTLDCWSGNYAQASYVYRIPRRAFDVRHVVYGQHNCCDSGRTTIAGKRTSPSRYRTTVRVTNWRSYTVEWADLRYKYRVRR